MTWSLSGHMHSKNVAQSADLTLHLHIPIGY